MNESKRDLEMDKQLIDESDLVLGKDPNRFIRTVAFHAIDRAIEAEKHFKLQVDGHKCTAKQLSKQVAITKLAIKTLKEISKDTEKAEFVSLVGAGYFKDFIMDKADDTLSEIAKLTHEKSE